MPKPQVLYVSAVPELKGGAEAILLSMLVNPLVKPVLAAPEPGSLSEAAAALGVPVCFYHPGAMLRVHRPLRPGAMLAACLDVVRCAIRLRRLAWEHGCQVIHSNGLKPHVVNALAGLGGRLRVVAHMHDIAHHPVERLIWRGIAAAMDRMIVVSRPCWPGTRLPPKVRWIANAFTPALTVLPPRTLGERLRLGFVGRFTRFKGLDLLIDWALALRQQGVPFLLTLRGRPDAEAPGYWHGIQARIVAEGLSDQVVVDGWRDRATLYDDLDVLLVPSHVPDPLPLVAGEAMAAGVIAAIYPAGGMLDYIEDGRSGLLIHHAADLVIGLQRLMAEPAFYTAMRQAAHQVALDGFRMDRFHVGLAALYGEMLPGPLA